MAAGKEMVKPAEYAMLKMDQDDLALIIEENLAGESINEFDLDRVSMPTGGGQSWTIPTLEGEDSAKDVEGVIIHWKDTRSYWPGAYSGGNEPPQCSSNDAILATGDPGHPVPQDNGMWICERCPNSQFGSHEDGRQQACKLSRILFVLTPEQLLPLVVALPPTSVQEAKRYFLRLSSRAVPFSSVVTRIGLDKAKSGGNIDYSKATFELAGKLSDEQVQVVREYAAKLKPAFERTSVNRGDLNGESGGDQGLDPDAS